MAKDDESLNVPLKGVENLQRLLMNAHNEGSNSNADKHEATDEYSEKFGETAIDPEQAKKDVRNAKSKARRVAKKSGQDLSQSISSTSGKSANDINGTPSFTGKPDIVNRVAGVPQSMSVRELNENANANISTAADSGPQPGVGAIGQAESANKMLQNLSNSRRDYNNATNKKNPFVEDAATAAKNVESAKQTSQSDQQQSPGPLNMNMGASGGSPSSGGGGTRPWWMKMQDTLDDIRDDIRKLLDATGHKKPGSSEARAKNDSQTDGGGLASALTPLMLMIGAALVAKFGPMAAQVLSKVSNAVESGIKGIESMISGVATDSKKVLSEAEALLKAAGKAAGVAAKVEPVVATVAPAAETSKSLFERVSGGIEGLAAGAAQGARKLAGKGFGMAAGAVHTPLKIAATGASLFGLYEAGTHAVRAGQDVATGDKAGAAGETMETLGTALQFGGPDKLVEHLPVVGKSLAKVLGKPGSMLADRLAKFAGREAAGGAIGGAIGGIPGAVAGTVLEYTGGYAMQKGGQFVESLGSPGAKIESPLDLLHEARDKKVEAGRKAGRESLGVTAGMAGGAGIGAAIGTMIFPGAGTVAGGLIGGAVGGVSAMAAEYQWKKAHPDEVLNQVNQVAAAKSEYVPSVARTAASTAATMPKPNINNNVNTTNTTNINIARADVTTPDAAKKLIADALKRQAVANASKKTAKEAYSNPGGGNFFNTIGNDITAIASVMFG